MESDPLPLSPSPETGNQPAFLVQNDDNNQPEIWTPRQVEQNQRFREMLVAAPRPIVVPALVAVNCLLFLIRAAMLRSLSPTRLDTLLQWGAEYGPLTTHGQWWRMFTAMFLHLNLLHVGMNMLCLYMIGDLVERLYGRVRFAILYVISGLGGSLLSLYWHPYAVSAGASGAVFGAYACALGFLVMQHNIVPGPRMRSLGKTLVFFVVINLVYGLASAGVNVAAHVGGAAAGFLLGAAFTRAQMRRDKALRLRFVAITVAVSAAVVAVLASRLVVDDYATELTRLFRLQFASFRLYDSAITELAAKRIGDAEFRDTVEQRILAPWKEERGRLAMLRLRKPEREMIEAWEKFMDSRQSAWTTLEQAALTNDSALYELVKQEVRATAEIGKAADARQRELQKHGPQPLPTIPGRPPGLGRIVGQ